MLKFAVLSAGVLAIGLSAAAEARTIEWSGYTWSVRNSGGAQQGPNANVWSNSTDSVWVDEEGDLHLKIRKVGNTWVAAEIDLTESLSYGTYEWELSTQYDQLADNVVIGLFTYQSPQSVANQTSGSVGNGVADTPHEIDIEMTGDWGSGNLYYTTHDPDVTSPSKNFYQALGGDYTTHRFTWAPDYIHWNSYNGHVAGIAHPEYPIVEQRPGSGNGQIAEFHYDGPVIPQDLNEIPIINFWITNNNASTAGPFDGQEQELVIHSFTYTPLPEDIPGDINGDGFVGLDDLDIILNHWNEGTPPTGGSPSIPEPASATVLGLSMCLFGLRRNR